MLLLTIIGFLICLSCQFEDGVVQSINLDIDLLGCVTRNAQFLLTMLLRSRCVRKARLAESGRMTRLNLL